MKKYSVLILIFFLLLACSGSEDSENGNGNPEEEIPNGDDDSSGNDDDNDSGDDDDSSGDDDDNDTGDDDSGDDDDNDDSSVDDDDDNDDDSDDGEMIWRLDGVEVAHTYGADAVHFPDSDSASLFLPAQGRHDLRVVFNAYSAFLSGYYDCDDFISGIIHVTLSTLFRPGFENLPLRWKDLIMTYCGMPGEVDDINMWIDFEEVGTHLQGDFHCTIIGAGIRMGETLTVDAEFDLDVQVF